MSPEAHKAYPVLEHETDDSEKTKFSSEILINDRLALFLVGSAVDAFHKHFELGAAEQLDL